jgi:hypothetical protein
MRPSTSIAAENIHSPLPHVSACDDAFGPPLSTSSVWFPKLAVACPASLPYDQAHVSGVKHADRT